MTTIGQLASALYAKYERALHDETLAAVATEVALNELLSGASTQQPKGARVPTGSRKASRQRIRRTAVH